MIATPRQAPPTPPPKEGAWAALLVIGADSLRSFVADIFAAAGCDREEAGRIGFYLVAANLSGHDSHGVIRAPRYVEYVRDGRVVKNVRVSVVCEGPTHAVVDGGYGFGQTVGPQAVDIGIAKARAAGMAIVALRHSGHIGRIGDWGERAAAAGLISIHFVNVENGELVAPFGGVGVGVGVDIGVGRRGGRGGGGVGVVVLGHLDPSLSCFGSAAASSRSSANSAR